MVLLTKELRHKLRQRPLRSTEGKPWLESVCKFFTPWSVWTWHVFEFDGEDTFFGFVEGFEREWGYFSLQEISSVNGPWGLKVERDRHYTPVTKESLS